MAFIPEDDNDSKESGMNVLAEQPQVSQSLPSETQQNDTIISSSPTQLGAQTNNISQQSEQQSSGKPKGSGMYTNVRKYIQANTGAGNRLGGAVGKNISQSTTAVTNQLAEQKANIQKQQQAQQQAIAQTQQVAQQAQQQAGQLVNADQLAAERQRMQSRINALGELQEGGYEQNINQSQQAYNAFIPQVEQAQVAQQQAIQTIQQQQQALNDAQNAYNQYKQQSQYANYSDENLKQMMDSWRTNANMKSYYEPYDAVMAQMNQAKTAYDQAIADQQTKQSALDESLAQQQQLQKNIDQYNTLQEKYGRQQDILGQLQRIDQQIEGGIESLDPESLQNVRNFLSGNQQFDVGNLNATQAENQITNLLQQSQGLESREDIRRRLLKDTFGGQYNRGASSLDDLILTRTGQLGKLKDVSQQASSNLTNELKDARSQREILRNALLEKAKGARESTTANLESQLANIMQNLEQRATTGETGRLGELYQALQSPEGLSQQQLDMLGGEQKIYGLDLKDAFQKAIAGQEIQAGDVASATEKARINALQQLLGQENQLDIKTAEPNEFTTAERGVFENIKSQIKERENQYKTAEQGVINEVTSGWGEIVKPIANQLAGYARSGTMPSDAELYKLQDSNYWTHAGMGRHGWAMPIDDMKAIISRLSPALQQVDESFNIQNKSLKSFNEGQAAKDGMIKRNILRKLIG